MGGEPGPPFRRRQADFLPHFPRKPRIRAGFRRPDTFVEPAEDQEIDRLQPGLQRPPDMDTRVRSNRSRHRHFRHQICEERRVVGRRHGEVGGRREAVEKFGEGASARPLPERTVAAAVVGRGSAERRDEEAGRHVRRQFGIVAERRFERPEDRLESFNQLPRERPVRRREAPAGAGDVTRLRVLGLAPRRRQRRRQPADAAVHPSPAEYRQLEEPHRPATIRAVHPESGEGMLEEGEQPHRVAVGDHGFGEEPDEDARGQKVEARASRIVDGEVPAAKLGGDTTGQRPVRRHQGDGGRELLERLADGDGDGDRLLLLVMGDDQRDSRQRRFDRPLVERRGAEAGPMLGGLGGAERLRQEPCPEGDLGRRRNKRLDLFARHPHVRDQLLDAELRMAGGAVDGFPASPVEIAVESRQDDRTVRKAGDGIEQPRRRRDRAGRAGGDDRPLRRPVPQPFRLGTDQRVAALRRIDEVVFGEVRRPSLESDSEEVESDLEIAGMIIGREIADRFRLDTGRRHVVHQSGEVGGETGRIGRRGGNEERFARPEGQQLAANGAAPGKGQSGQRQLPRELRDRRGQHQPVRLGFRRWAEKMILFVDVADRTDRRQDRRVAAEAFGHHRAQRPDGAARRQENGHVGERQRIAGVRRRRQTTGKNRIGEGRQERRARRNGEEPWRIARHGAVRRRCRRSSSPPSRWRRACRHGARVRPCGRRGDAPPRSPCRTAG